MYESSIYFNFYKISFVIVKIAMQNITLYRFYLRSIQITQPNFLKILVIIDGAEILISHLQKKFSKLVYINVTIRPVLFFL